MEMTSCNKPDFNRLGAKLQQAGKIDNFQKISDVFGCIFSSEGKYLIDFIY